VHISRALWAGFTKLTKELCLSFGVNQCDLCGRSKPDLFWIEGHHLKKLCPSVVGDNAVITAIGQGPDTCGLKVAVESYNGTIEADLTVESGKMWGGAIIEVDLKRITISAKT
jgi:hypothetical protein